MRITVKVEQRVHKYLKKLQYEKFKRTGIQVTLSDIIEEAIKWHRECNIAHFVRTEKNLILRNSFIILDMIARNWRNW